MCRCAHVLCPHYSRPLDSYFPGQMWVPIFDLPRRILENKKIYAAAAREAVGSVFAGSNELFDEYIDIVKCEHEKIYVFEEAGFKFAIGCMDEKCDREIKERMRESPLKMVAKTLKNLFSECVRKEREILKPSLSLLRALELSPSWVAEDLCIRVSIKFTRHIFKINFTSEDGWQTEDCVERNVSSIQFLQKINSPLVSNVELIVEECPIHGAERK